MAKRKKTRKLSNISTREGLLFGFILLGQVTGLLATGALIGYGTDKVFHSHPVGLITGVIAGSAWATIIILVKTKRELLK